MITCHKISKSFKLNGRPLLVLDQVSLHVDSGECVALIGPSGCGKSTLLGLAAGFYPPDSGQISVTERPSLMMQRDMLLPHRDILGNAILPIEARSDKRSQLSAARQQAEALLPLFGLDGFGRSYPAQLSGGMRQRAALLRTVMDGRRLWLLDEPFGKLDALTKAELLHWLDDIRRRYSSTLLLVTHDMHEALQLADRIYVLSSRPGRIVGEVQVQPGNTDGQVSELRRLLASGIT